MRAVAVADTRFGTKRTCTGCGARFYDFHKAEPSCPKCKTVVVILKAPEPVLQIVPDPEPEEEEESSIGRQMALVEMEDVDLDVDIPLDDDDADDSDDTDTDTDTDIGSDLDD